MNILLCLSHSIEEHDQLRLFSSLGYGVASIGGYIDPRNPHDPKRPPLDIDCVEPIKTAVDAMGQPDNLGAAQAQLPDAALDWADVIIYHHHLHRLFNQWDRIAAWLHAGSQRRVIWRTVGQSTEYNEVQARPFRAQGLEVIRYSPKERNIPGYCGEDALIRFYKDPAEWQGWTGEREVVLNIAQHDATPHGRDEWLNWRFWEQATQGLPTVVAGTHSEMIGGLGQLPLPEMQALLRSCRVFLYTGTQPASYTLGLIEAMMTGIPVVSIGPGHMNIFPYGPALFEGHEIAAPDLIGYADADDPTVANALLYDHLYSPGLDVSSETRQRAIDLFGMETIARQWAAFLGSPVLPEPVHA